MDDPIERLVLHSLQGPSLAVALYGSEARGTARLDSDVDVLQVVERSPKTYSAGRVNVSAYHHETLREMARRGSLFILHLRIDAVILKDSNGILAGILDSYRSPQTYSPLLREIRAAASALYEVADTSKHRESLRRLGIYLVRTAAYARLAERGTPTFEAGRAADLIGLEPIRRSLFMRFEETSPDDLDTLLAAIAQLVGEPARNQFGSIEALAVSYVDTYPYASSLLAQVISGEDDGIEYTALTPPPL